MTRRPRSPRVAALLLAIAAPAMSAPASAPADPPGWQAAFDFDDLVDRCRPGVRWLADGATPWISRIGAEGRVFERIDLSNGRRAPLFDTARLRAAVARAIGHDPVERGVPFAAFTPAGGDAITATIEGRDYRISLADYGVTPLPAPDPVEEMYGTSPRARLTPRSFKREMFVAGENDATEILSTDGRSFASLKDGNIWLRSTADGRSMPLTGDGTRDINWDIDDSTGTPWSPNGEKLFAIRYDRSAVFRVPRIHYLKRDEELDFIRQQKAGAAIDRASLFLVPVLGKPPVPIDVGDTTDRYFRLLGWAPDGSAVLFARFDRQARRADIFAADAVTGVARILFTETAPGFVRDLSAVIWGMPIGFTMLPGDQGFLWESTRDGWNQLYHYGLDGKLRRQLTRGAGAVGRVVRVADGEVYYLAAREGPRPYDQQLYRVPLAGGEPRRLTDGDGIHQIGFAPSGRYFVDSWSTVSAPPRTVIRDVEGRVAADLGVADTHALAAAGLGTAEEFTVKAADGVTDLHGVLIKPPGFDPARRYPLLEYVYGGPQVAIAQRTFCPVGDVQAFNHAMAQAGMVVMMLDGRGTPGRSRAFQNAVIGDWADHVVADHAGAVRQLLARDPWIDGDRVGVYGWSWGGYFAFRFLADAPDLYKAGVSVVPGFDPYRAVIYEPYLGLPDVDNRAYEAASPFRLAPRVKGRYLMIGGLLDNSTTVDIYRMADALVAAGVPHTQLLVPNQEHHFGGQAAAYQFRTIRDFFTDALAR